MKKPHWNLFLCLLVLCLLALTTGANLVHARSMVIMNFYHEPDETHPYKTLVFDQNSNAAMEDWDTSFENHDHFVCNEFTCTATANYLALRRFCFVGNPQESCAILDRVMKITAPIHEHIAAKHCGVGEDSLELSLTLVNDYEFNSYHFDRVIGRCE